MYVRKSNLLYVYLVYRTYLRYKLSYASRKYSKALIGVRLQFLKPYAHTLEIIYAPLQNGI